MTTPHMYAATFLLLIGALSACPAAAGPAFGQATVAPGSACLAKDTLFSRSADNSVLSVVRKQGVFVENQKGSSKRVHASCQIDFVFSAPLEAPATLQLDMRGVQFKGAQAEMSTTLRLGAQRHQVDHARGEILDGTPLYRRFQLVDLARGTRKVRLEMKGKAKSLNKTDPAHLSIDTFDLCFVDPAKAQACASNAPKPEPK